MATSKLILSGIAYTSVAAGGAPLLLQARDNNVRLVFSASQPSAMTDGYHILSPDLGMLQWAYADVALWAMSVGANSVLIVTTGV